MSPPALHFIGNTAPAPALIAQWCRSRWPETLPPGLRFCVPTALAFRRLRDALTETYGAFQGVSFLLPAGILDLFDRGSGKTASPAEVLLLWNRVFTWLQQQDSAGSVLEALFPGKREWLERPRARFSAARRLIRLRKTLAEARLDFGAVAAHPATAALAPREQLRWQALDLLETRYREELKHADLEDPIDRQIAVFNEPRFRDPETGGPARLIVAGVPDMMPALGDLLFRVPACDILVLADPADAAHFTPTGLPDPAHWNRTPLDLPLEAIVPCETPIDEADAICDRLAARGSVDPAELCLAILNPETIRPLRSHLAAKGITLFEPEPISLASRFPVRLLTAMATLTPALHPRALLPLLSAPEVADCLGREVSTLRAAYNTLIEEHQPETILAARAFAIATDLEPFFERVTVWMNAFRSQPVQACRTFLCELYGTRPLDPVAAPLDFEAFKSLRELFSELEDIRLPGEQVTAELLLARIATGTLSPLRCGADCACEGRLEFLWSPAPLLFLSGLNESIFPDSTFEDAFLPNRFRSELGLRADLQRAARDAYLLATACRQHRPDELFLSAARSSLRGDWLKPSRLFFRCDPSRRALLARRFFKESAAQRPSAGITSALAFRENPVCWRRLDPPARLSPSAIRAYLLSPLDYWLRYRLQLRETDSLPDGVSPALRGSLLHEVLALLPQIPGETPEAITPPLLEALHAAYRRAYGEQPPVEVLAARLEAEHHLRSMARCEAGLRAEGWETRYAETGLHDPDERWSVTLTTPAGPVKLFGRIDRVDFHPADGRWRIIDYKTTHNLRKEASGSHYEQKKDETLWRDFQLPIYRLILRKACSIPPETPIDLGYILLNPSAQAAFSRYTDPVSEARTEEDLRETLHAMLTLGTEPLPADIGPYGNPLLEFLTAPTLPRPEATR